MSAEDTDQREQCKLFEWAEGKPGETARFDNSARFTVKIPKKIPKTRLRLIPAAKNEPEIVVLSTFNDRAILYKVSHFLSPFLISSNSASQLINSVIDVSVPNPNPNDPIFWLHQRENSSKYCSISSGINRYKFQESTKLLMNDMVLGCDKEMKLEIRYLNIQIRKKMSLSEWNCDTEMIGEKNGECFGVVRKEDGDQASLHLIQKSDLTEYRQSIPIDNAFKPGVLSEDCTMHAQKTKNGIRVMDIKNGGITKEIHLDGMEPGQIMFFDDASKVIVSEKGDPCQFQVMDVHSGIKLDITQILTFEGCSNLVKSGDGGVMFLSQKRDGSGAVLMSVLKCNDVCRMIGTRKMAMPSPDFLISLPSPNYRHIALLQKSTENLSSHSRIVMIDIHNGELVDQLALDDLPWNGVQWQSESKLNARYFFDWSVRIESYSLKDRNMMMESESTLGDFTTVFQRCSRVIQFPYDTRVLCAGNYPFFFGARQDDYRERDQSASRIAILPDPNFDSDHFFSIDRKWLITDEEYPINAEKRLIKWFHSDSLDLYRSCEYSKRQIQGLKIMQSCWMDRDTNVYSDGSKKLKVQRIGVGILDEMNIGYIPTALQCANGFILTSSDKGVIHAWNLTFRARSQSAHRLPVISNPSRFRSPITRANRSTQTESVLAYPERVRTLQMRAERGSVLATAEGYRSEPARKPHYALVIGGIAAGVLLVSVLIALLIWMRVRRVNQRTKKAEGRNTRTVTDEMDPTLEPGLVLSSQQSIEMVRARIFAQGEGSVSLEGNDDESDGCDGQTEGVKPTAFQSEDSFTFKFEMQTDTAQRNGDR